MYKQINKKLEMKSGYASHAQLGSSLRGQGGVAATIQTENHRLHQRETNMVTKPRRV